MATSIETMKTFMNVLKQYANDTTTSGITILDNAVRAVSRFAGLQDAVNSFVNDVTDTSRTPDTAQRLKETCGIVLGADDDFTVDTGAASGANAGNGTVKNAVTIVPETGTLTELSMPAAGSTTTHSYTTSDGQTFSFNIQWPSSFTQVVDRKWQNYDDSFNPDAWTTEELTDQTFTSDPNNNQNTKTYTAEQLKDSIEAITKGMEHWWVTESAKLIYDTYGLDFNGKTLKVKYTVNSFMQADTGADGKNDNDTTPADVIEMSIGLPVYGKIDPADVNGNTRIEGGMQQCYLDRTIAHEMVHAVMQGNGSFKIYNGKTSQVTSMPEFFTEGVAELIMGLDDFDGQNVEDIREIAADREKLSNAMALASGTGTRVRYTSGYMFLRYLCQQSLDSQSADTPSAGMSSAQEALSNIDAQGGDYGKALLLQALSGHSAARAARYTSAGDKVMNYGASSSLSDLAASSFRNSDSLSLVSESGSQETILVSPQSV